MNVDRKIIYAALVLLVSASIFGTMSNRSILDADYAILNHTHLSMDNLQMINLGLALAVPILVYAVSVYVLKAEQFDAMCASVLLALSGAIYYGLFSINPLAGVFLGKAYPLSESIRLAGGVLPLGAASLLLFKDNRNIAILGALGLIALPFAPALAAIALALAASKTIASMADSKESDRMFVFSLVVFGFQWSYSGDIASAAVLALFIGAAGYLLTMVHRIGGQDAHALTMMLLAFGVFSMIVQVSVAYDQAIGADEISAFKKASAIEGTIGVLDYPEAFRYYSGKEPKSLNATSLLSELSRLPDGVDHVLYSSRSLDRSGLDRRIFAYAGTSTVSDPSGNGTYYYAIFLSADKKYQLRMALTGKIGDFAIEDGYIFSEKGNTKVPFTKIRFASGTDFRAKSSRIIDISGVETSPLYKILFGSKEDYSIGSVRSVSVSG